MSRVDSWYVACMKPRSLSPKEPTLHTVVSSIAQLTKQVTGAIQELSHSVRGLEKEVGLLKEDVGWLKEKVGSIEEGMGSMAETIEFVKDTAVTRDEFKTGLRDVENKIIDHVDHFVKLHMKQEVEIAAVAHSVIRHEQTFHGRQAAV